MNASSGKLGFAVLFGNQATEEWEAAGKFDVLPYAQPNWGMVSPAEALELRKGKWQKVNLPNEEVLEIQTIYVEEQRRLTVHVRQGMEPVAQLMCEGTPSMIFRTLSGASIEVAFGLQKAEEAG